MPTTLPIKPDTRAEANSPYGLLGLVLSTVAILVLAGLFCVLAAALAFGAASAVVGWHSTLQHIVDLDTSGGTDAVFREKLAVAVSLVVYAALVAAILVMARWRGGDQWRALVAWAPWSPLRGALPFWGLIALTLAYSLAANAAIAHVYPGFEDLVQMPTGVKWAVLFFLLAAVFAPVAEELLFRGWIYTSLRETIGIWAAILVTATLFALAHWESTHLYALAVFPVGLALGFVRERTGSIRATMTFHAVYNGVASILLLFAH